MLEDLAWSLELGVEVPAPTEGAYGRFLPVALPADHADFRAIGAIGKRARYAEDMVVNRIVQVPPLPTYFSGSSSWYEGSTILYFFGRSTQSWRPRGSGLPGSSMGISAWMTGNRTFSEPDYDSATSKRLLPRPCYGEGDMRLL